MTRRRAGNQLFSTDFLAFINFSHIKKAISEKSCIERVDMNHISGHNRLLSALRGFYIWIAVNGVKSFVGRIFLCSTLNGHWENRCASILPVQYPVLSKFHAFNLLGLNPPHFSLPPLHTLLFFPEGGAFETLTHCTITVIEWNFQVLSQSRFKFMKSPR